MKVKPIFALSALASALVLPTNADALGLGRLSVQSSIGQPLVARIEIMSATAQEIDSLAARVADPSLYRQNNLAYNGILARARVTVERGSGGDAYLKIVTTNAVNEPYLDLMVEVNWPSGRLVREYTFLLDPPGIQSPPVDPVTPARAGIAPPRTAAAPAAAPAAPAAATAPSAGTAASAPAAPATAPRERAPAPAAGAGAGGGEQYQVKRGDTLWKIASEFKPPAITPEQMMVALFETNQRAFDGGNINRLRAGAIVTMPAPEVAGAVSTQEAARVVRMQASEWRSYRDRVAATAPTGAADGTRSSAGRIGAKIETPPLAPPGRDQLKVSREAGAGKGAGAGSVTTEDLVARERQIREAQIRIAELEKTLHELKRAVELKNQSMAQLQAQAETTKGTGAPGKAAEPAKPAAAPEAAKAEPAKAAAAPAAPVTTGGATPPASATAPDAAKPAEAPKAGDAGKAGGAAPPAGAEAPKAVEPAKPAEAPKAADAVPPKAAPAGASAAPAPKSTSTLIDGLLSSVPVWAAGGGALALVAGLAAWLLARRRKAPVFENSLTADSDVRTKTVFGETAGGVVDTGTAAAPTDAAKTGEEGESDEVDPIAEAEVYLAYGRDAQAEEILRHALRKNPQRQEVYVKLLEIHAQHNKPSAFESVATELFTVSGGKGEAWQKAAALGRELDPKNPLFGGSPDDAAAFAAAGGAGAAAFAAAGDDASLDARLDADLGMTPRPTAPVPVEPSFARNEAAEDFDRTVRQDWPAAGALAAQSEDAALRADGQAPAFERVAEAAPASSTIATMETADAEDLSLHLAANEAEGPIDLAKAGEELQFELASQPSPPVPVVEEKSVPEGLPDLDFVLDAPVPAVKAPAASATSSVPAIEQPVDDLGSDEMSKEVPEDDRGLRFDLEHGLPPVPSAAPPVENIEAPPPPPATPEPLSLDFDLDALGGSLGAGGAPAGGAGGGVPGDSTQDEAGDALGGQWHDAATKLDLAKAYQEMGDVEGAREILEEVLVEGNPQQRAEASALIAKLG